MLPLSNPNMERDESHNAVADTGPGGEEFDLSLLHDSLRLTPWERLLENERALALVRMLEAAQTHSHGSPKSDS